MENQEFLGYIKAHMETIHSDLIKLRQDIEALRISQDSLREEVREYKIKGTTIYKTVRLVIWTGIATITFIFGDFLHLVQKLFGK